jgi:hypothetical protein
VSRYPKPAASTAQVPPFNEKLRYRVPMAAAYLAQSVASTWNDIRAGKLRVIRDGARTFVPGGEIVRRCQLAESAPPSRADAA